MPVKAVGLQNIVKVSGGALHSFAISQNGDLFTWGENDSGQLGQPITQFTAPVLLYLTEDDYPNQYNLVEAINLTEEDELSIEGTVDYCLDTDWFAIDLESKSKTSIILDCDDPDVSIKTFRIDNEKLMLLTEQTSNQLVLSQGIYYNKMIINLAQSHHICYNKEIK